MRRARLDRVDGPHHVLIGGRRRGHAEGQALDPPVPDADPAWLSRRRRSQLPVDALFVCGCQPVEDHPVRIGDPVGRRDLDFAGWPVGEDPQDGVDRGTRFLGLHDSYLRRVRRGAGPRDLTGRSGVCPKPTQLSGHLLNVVGQISAPGDRGLFGHKDLHPLVEFREVLAA